VLLETWTISIYLLIATGITLILGHILYHRGAVLLQDVFSKQAHLAIPVNNIMLCGFYLLNIGMSILYYTQGIQLDSTLDAFHFLCNRIGGLLTIIGGMHIVNVLFFLVIKWHYLTTNKTMKTI